MDLDETSKVIILPKDQKSFEILHLPWGETEKSILVTETSIYELREVTGFSSYETHPEPKLPSGGAVKSIIIESDSQGFVLRSPNVIACSKFNLIYFVLRLMYARVDLYSARFQTFDDILDSFKGSNWVDQLRGRLEEPFRTICESILENGDEFFKLSMPKVLNFLAEKVEQVSSLLLKSPEFALARKVRSTLHSSLETPPAEIVELQTLRYSVDLVFGSYLNDKLKKEYMDAKNVDFSKLTDFLHEQAKKLRDLAVVEENMTTVAQATAKAKANGKATKTTKTTKKITKKVAVGKGALDGFFKRQ